MDCGTSLVKYLLFFFNILCSVSSLQSLCFCPPPFHIFPKNPWIYSNVMTSSSSTQVEISEMRWNPICFVFVLLENMNNTLKRSSEAVVLTVKSPLADYDIRYPYQRNHTVTVRVNVKSDRYYLESSQQVTLNVGNWNSKNENLFFSQTQS